MPSGRGDGGARELKPPPRSAEGDPLRMIPRRSYPSWSGAENRDNDRDTLIEQLL